MTPVASPSSRCGRRGALPLFLATLVLAGAASGCATRAQDLARVRSALLQGDAAGALAEFEKTGGKEDDLLHLLEKGYLLHANGQWAESNAAFELAEARAEDLYSRSLSREAAALLTSDNALPYRGHPYELQMIQYYRALNYLQLGSLDGALVEARKANWLTEQVYAREDAEEGEESGRRLPPTTHPNAFLDYFTGLLWLRAGEWNDAVVSLRRAYEGYGADSARYGVEIPGTLVRDFHAALERTGQSEEAARVRTAHPGAVAAADPQAHRIVVFFESGFVPHRESVDINLPIFDRRGGGDAWLYVDEYSGNLYAYQSDVELDHVLRFAFPRLQTTPSAVARCELDLPAGRVVPATPVLDLQAIAEDDFGRRLPRILLKTVARALVKEAQRKAAKKEDEVLGWIVNAINVATEQADTRSWILLPGRIDVVDLELPVGTEEIRGRCLDGSGRTIEEWRLTVGGTAPQMEFIALRTYD